MAPLLMGQYPLLAWDLGCPAPWDVTWGKAQVWGQRGGASRGVAWSTACGPAPCGTVLPAGLIGANRVGQGWSLADARMCVFACPCPSHQDLIVDQTIEKVSFCAPDRNFDKAFSYICRDGTTRRWICHCFLALKDSVREHVGVQHTHLLGRARVGGVRAGT